MGGQNHFTTVTDGEISQLLTEQFSINVVAAPVVEKPAETLVIMIMIVIVVA